MKANKQNRSPRQIAVQVLVLITCEQSNLTQAINDNVDAQVTGANTGFIKDVTYGVMRWLPRLEFILRQLLKKPLKHKDQDIYCNLLIALYQLQFSKTPDHAVINESVNLVKLLKKEWAAAFTNGVLREYQRNAEQLLAQCAQHSEASTAHPAWLLNRLKTDWPQDWQRIVTANNEKPPLTLRINRQRNTVDEYLRMLAESELAALRHPVVDGAVELVQPIPVQQIPGFMRGAVSVQDAAAQLAAGLLCLEAGQRVLDACAAPGGKSGHILEAEPAVHLHALDINEQRLALIKQNLTRLDLRASLLQGDAATPQDWWDGELYDRILLDAPCSAIGVIRRNPDIKHLRDDAEIHHVAQTQQKLLHAMWSLLKPGGILVYATCSILREENEAQLQQFLSETADAQEYTIDANWGSKCAVGRQILPGDLGMDGFYYARLSKNI